MYLKITQQVLCDAVYNVTVFFILNSIPIFPKKNLKNVCYLRFTGKSVKKKKNEFSTVFDVDARVFNFRNIGKKKKKTVITAHSTFSPDKNNLRNVRKVWLSVCGGRNYFNPTINKKKKCAYFVWRIMTKNKKVYFLQRIKQFTFLFVLCQIWQIWWLNGV